MSDLRGRLHIVHVVDSLEFGGLERVVTDLAIAQHAAGHTVDVFSISRTDGFRGQLEAAGIAVTIGDKSSSFDRRVLRRLREATIGRGVDVVHAHSFVPAYHAAFSLMGTLRRPALVGTCHDMGARLAHARLRRLYRLSLLRTQRVAMVGGQVHERFVRDRLVPGKLATTVLNGIPVERFTACAERRAAARVALGLSADAPVVGTVGRLVELKNQSLLVDAVARLAPDVPGLQLVVVGEGPLAGELRERAEALGIGDRVHLPGARTDVAELLQAFDVFALPSRTEGLSIALLEACATGLGVVASRVGGNPEVVRDGDTGLLVPVDDLDALVVALDALLDSDTLRRRLGRAASRWVAERASIDAMRDAYDACYLAAMGEGGHA